MPMRWSDSALGLVVHSEACLWCSLTCEPTVNGIVTATDEPTEAFALSTAVIAISFRMLLALPGETGSSAASSLGRNVSALNDLPDLTVFCT